MAFENTKGGAEVGQSYGEGIGKSIAGTIGGAIGGAAGLVGDVVKGGAEVVKGGVETAVGLGAGAIDGLKNAHARGAQMMGDTVEPSGKVDSQVESSAMANKDQIMDQAQHANQANMDAVKGITADPVLGGSGKEDDGLAY